jgi:hypothetical protein
MSESQHLQRKYKVQIPKTHIRYNVVGGNFMHSATSKQIYATRDKAKFPTRQQPEQAPVNNTCRPHILVIKYMKGMK